MSVLVRAARAIAGGKERSDFCFAIENGRIAAIAPAADLEKRFPGAEKRSYGSGVALIPGFVNGHSHAYQILLRGRADDVPFARWRTEWLYRLIPPLSPEEVATVFRQAFSEMLAAGITTVAEFFYLNGFGNEHAAAAIEAANETGIRLVFARCWMDAPHAPDAFRESIDTAAARTRELIDRYPEANVCVAPHSVHGASPEMIRAAAEFARERNCPLHAHLAEAKYELEQTKAAYGKTPLRLLESLDALNERLVAIHAIHLDEEEKDALARSGASVIHNPVTNQYLGDGIADVAGFRKRAARVGLGTDANLNASVFDEMRSAALLQKLAHGNAGAFGAADAFDLATAAGASALRIDSGDFREGAFADYAVVATDRVDSWSPLVNALVYRANASWVRETYVGGRRVYDGSRGSQTQKRAPVRG
jgi:5-methylthioadenosine/S-adenosylhomocysteine deaminase